MWQQACTKFWTFVIASKEAFQAEDVTAEQLTKPEIDRIQLNKQDGLWNALQTELEQNDIQVNLAGSEKAELSRTQKDTTFLAEGIDSIKAHLIKYLGGFFALLSSLFVKTGV